LIAPLRGVENGNIEGEYRKVSKSEKLYLMMFQIFKILGAIRVIKRNFTREITVNIS